MKSLIEFLNESRTYWQPAYDTPQSKDMEYSEDKPFLWFTTEGQVYGFMSEKMIKEFENDDDANKEDIKAILDLKPGEMFDADGGINIYIRIKE